LKPFAIEDKALRAVGAVDAEAYWIEPADLWTSRAPARFKDRVPQPRTVVHGETLVGGLETVWVIDGKLDFAFGTQCAFDTAGEKYPMGKDGLPDLGQIDPAASSAKERVALLDRQGIAAQILYPTVAGLSGVHFTARLRDRELEVECIKIYNDAAAELQAASGNRLFPRGSLPARADDALAELRRATEEL
jgi:hypothetical protein